MSRARGTQHRAAAETVFERMIYRVPLQNRQGFHKIILATRKQMKNDTRHILYENRHQYANFEYQDIEP